MPFYILKQSDLDDRENLVSEHSHKGKACRQSAAVFNVVNSIIGSGIIGKLFCFYLFSEKATFKTFVILLAFIDYFQRKQS